MLGRLGIADGIDVAKASAVEGIDVAKASAVEARFWTCETGAEIRLHASPNTTSSEQQDRS